MNQVAQSNFKFLIGLNDLDMTEWLGSTAAFNSRISDEFFCSDSLQDKVLRAIAAERFLPIKEVLESFEFFARIRKSVRTNNVADLCCGHGLLGILFAIFERKVDRVLLVDRIEPVSRQILLDIVADIAPWIVPKIENRIERIESHDKWMRPGTAIVSAHACGILSDTCIDLAIRSNGPLAILPCCYPQSACQAPLSLQTALGLSTAFDVDRTYRLEAAGYQVRWAEIPHAITPMNRIIYAVPTFA